MGANLTEIELHPTPITAMIGDVIGLEIWGLYNNGSTSQLIVQPENPTFSSSNPVVAMRVNNPDRSPLWNQSLTRRPTPSGFAEIISDDFSIFHSSDRGQRSIYIWENLKYLIKPRSLENRTHGFVQTSQEKLATKAFNLLHG